MAYLLIHMHSVFVRSVVLLKHVGFTVFTVVFFLSMRASVCQLSECCTRFLSSNETHASFDIRHQANTYDERDRFLTKFYVFKYLTARAVLFDRVATSRKGVGSRDNTRAETITGSATSPFPYCRYQISWQHARASHPISRANISCHNFLQQLASD